MVIDYTSRNLWLRCPTPHLAVPLVDTAYVTCCASVRRKIYQAARTTSLRLRRRLGGSTVATVLTIYGLAAVLGGWASRFSTSRRWRQWSWWRWWHVVLAGWSGCAVDMGSGELGDRLGGGLTGLVTPSSWVGPG